VNRDDAPISTRSHRLPPRPNLENRRSAVADVARLQSVRDGARILASKQGDTNADFAAAKPGPIRARDKLFFFAQLSVMSSAGVPIAVALDGIARQSDRLKLREVLFDVLAQVEAGQTLSTGLARHPKIFEPQAVQLVRAGETCGDLSMMLSRSCDLLERDYEMKKKLKSALTYPVVMLTLAVTTVVFLFAFILPRFRLLYAGKEGALPKPTKMLLMVGDFGSAYWPWLAACGVAAIIGFIVMLRNEAARSALDTLLLRLPLIGNVIRRFSLARSVRTLGALLHGGVPVVVGLELARDLASNRRLSEAWEYVRLRVKDGGRIHEGMAGQEWFPGTLVQMTAMGESGGTLEAVLVQVGEFYDREAEVAVSDATGMLEPLMVIVVGGVVGFIAMSIMLPIFNMSKIVH
jgi:type IV pilus assembly protein PilC